MKARRIIAAGVLSLALLLPVPITAYAHNLPQYSTSENINTPFLIYKLMEKNPGASYQEIKETLEQAAAENNSTVEQIAREVLKEAQKQELPFDISSSSSKDDFKAEISILKAHNTGDIFYTPSSHFGINHGHSGIYTSTTTIIESLENEGVIERSYTEVKVAKGAKKQYVNTSQHKRNQAAERARTYIGRPYNHIFMFNKTEKRTMNCSQVVWAAYKYATDIDLDSDGGFGVYPPDIRDSPHVTTYETF